jgi:hypothetical protein
MTDRSGVPQNLHWHSSQESSLQRKCRSRGAVSINVRITAVRKLAVEAADNGLLAPELAKRDHAREGGRFQRRPATFSLPLPTILRPPSMRF